MLIYLHANNQRYDPKPKKGIFTLSHPCVAVKQVESKKKTTACTLVIFIVLELQLYSSLLRISGKNMTKVFFLNGSKMNVLFIKNL